jgi:uncharacterized protein YdaU (DUF1376 family)
MRRGFDGGVEGGGVVKGLPYFCWYPADAETDENFRAMTDAEVGFYLRCLNHAWINGGLPTDAGERARAMGRSRAQADRLWNRVSRCFVPDANDPARLINRRQEEERDRATERSKKGTQSAKARWDRRTYPPDANKMPPHREGNARASDSDSASGSASDPNPSNEERASSRARSEAVAVICPPELKPVNILAELRNVYAQGGAPIPDAHENLAIQYLLDIPVERRARVANYVKWAFVTGKWPSPAKTKGLLNLLRDGDWDVELTQRTLPQSAAVAQTTATQRAQAEAERQFRERKAARGAV